MIKYKYLVILSSKSKPFSRVYSRWKWKSFQYNLDWNMIRVLVTPSELYFQWKKKFPKKIFSSCVQLTWNCNLEFLEKIIGKNRKFLHYHCNLFIFFSLYSINQLWVERKKSRKNLIFTICSNSYSWLIEEIYSSCNSKSLNFINTIITPSYRLFLWTRQLNIFVEQVKALSWKREENFKPTSNFRFLINEMERKMSKFQLTWRIMKRFMNE